jgi:hypothetical protein
LDDLRTVTIENEMLRCTFLVGRGCDVIELLYKPKDVDFLWHRPQRARIPKGFTPTSYNARPFFDHCTGYGYFNRDIFLPSLLLERRYEVSDSLTYLHGKHRMKFGFNFLDRTNHSETYTFPRSITSSTRWAKSTATARTLRITRARDINLLPRPVGPLGIANWADPACSGAGIFGCFKDPTLYQDNLYESTANAFYNGMILEVSKRFGRNLSLAGNYTFSKALDEVTDYKSDYQANDQTNLRAERALPEFDQRHKIVFYAYLQSPFKGVSNGSLAKNILADFGLTPIFRYNSPRPFNLLAGVDTNGDRHSTTDRPIFAGRNTGIGPDFWAFDLRLARVIRMGGESRALELTAEAFNLFNRLNYGSVNNTVGSNFTGPFNVHANPNLGPSAPLGYTSALEARRIQLGLRFTF